MTEQTDRRARYAAAMDAVTGGICPTDLIDAVMAVADAELQQERERLFVPLHQAEADNARLRAVSSAGLAPATDQTALRDRIAEAIGRTDLLWWSKERRYEAANAVMAVLPAPDQRAAVLLEAADWFEQDRAVQRMFGHQVAAELRHLAGEAQQDEAVAPWATDGARIRRALIWSWSDIGKGEFGRGYRAAQEEARAILTRALTRVAQQDPTEGGTAEHTGGNAEDCPICRPEIDKTVLYPWICPGPTAVVLPGQPEEDLQDGDEPQ